MKLHAILNTPLKDKWNFTSQLIFVIYYLYKVFFHSWSLSINRGEWIQLWTNLSLPKIFLHIYCVFKKDRIVSTKENCDDIMWKNEDISHQGQVASHGEDICYQGHSSQPWWRRHLPSRTQQSALVKKTFAINDTAVSHGEEVICQQGHSRQPWWRRHLSSRTQQSAMVKKLFAIKDTAVSHGEEDISHQGPVASHGEDICHQGHNSQPFGKNTFVIKDTAASHGEEDICHQGHSSQLWRRHC